MADLRVGWDTAHQAHARGWPVWCAHEGSDEKITGFVAEINESGVVIKTEEGPYLVLWGSIRGFGSTNTDDDAFDSKRFFDTPMGHALSDITAERRRQDVLKSEGRFRFTCADEQMSNFERLACLMEEVGEVAQEVLTQKGRRLACDTEGSEEALRKEITQVAAICVAWLESPCNTHPRMGW